MTPPDSLADQMALHLLAVPELADDMACIRELIHHRFRAIDIFDNLDEARRLARAVLQAEGNIWSKLQLT